MRRWWVVLGVVACALAGVPVGMAPSQAEPAPVGLTVDPGVQPGGRVFSQVGGCTLNFMFRGSDGSRFMGTAGHCILGGGGASFANDESEEVLWPAGTGPEASDADGKRIGEFAYAVLGRPKDFSLIRLDPGVEASPQMAHFGGPTALYTATSPDMVTLHYYGQGSGLGLILPARTAQALDSESVDDVDAYGAAVPGDSGSGVITDGGEAVGALVSVGTNPYGPLRVTRLGPQLGRAEERLGIKLELQTAPKL